MGCGITSLQVPRTTRTTTTVTLTTIRHTNRRPAANLSTPLSFTTVAVCDACPVRLILWLNTHTWAIGPTLSWVATIIRHIDTIPAALTLETSKTATECRLTRTLTGNRNTDYTCTTSIWIRLAIAATNRRIQTGTIIGILKTNANSASAGRPTLIVD